ncbi:CDP-glycerol glycerophosphotransferase family protein [Methanobrevibacter sp.]|uniref:CDP-glycerol glycerophosphotransferase family protein n=1 Tax=Methanobrevibacter sp. TaxID=66852 RepID=UPI00388FDBC7
MYLKHKIFGKIFNVFAKFPVNNNLVSFIIDSNESFSGNLEYIKEEFEKRENYEFNFYYKDKLSFSSLKKLATSKYVFLNDNFFPIAFMKFSKKTLVIQLWHAPGAFKKFGGSVENREMLKLISNNTNFLIVTSKHIEDYYSEAFQIDKSKIKPLGLPRADYYFKNHDIHKLRENFNKKYDLNSDKKIILYAPTFRENKEFNNVFNYLNLEKFNEHLSDEYVLALRLHPKIKKFYSQDISVDGDYIDCSDYKNEQELLLISDILITDYSSIMIEFAMLNKPIIFFAYDLDNYLSNERGFYLDYKNDLPGPIVYSGDELIDVLQEDIDTSNLDSFLKTQFDMVDGDASKRIVDFTLNEGGKNE